MSEPAAFESVSTWRQPIPSTRSSDRAALLDALAGRVLDLGAARLRVAVDGRTAAGKTSFGHELAAAIRSRGRPTLRASLDDFKKPWSDAIEKGYDRTSGEGTTATHPTSRAPAPSCSTPRARTAQGRSLSVPTTR